MIAHEGILNSGAVTATSGGNVGGVIGYVDSVSIQADEDIINTGKISSMVSGISAGAGGLIGYGQGVSVISQNGMLQNKGEVTAAITGVGGIAGYLTSSNDNYRIQAAKGMINTGRITGQKTVGGIVGEYAYSAPMTSTDGFLLNTGDVEGNGANVGGVIGRMAATLDSGKYGNTGNVTNTGKYTGGVIGSWDNNKTSLENAFNTGNVVVTGEDAADVGGIAGRFTGVNIKNCYHTTEYPLIGNGEVRKTRSPARYRIVTVWRRIRYHGTARLQRQRKHSRMERLHIFWMEVEIAGGLN